MCFLLFFVTYIIGDLCQKHADINIYMKEERGLKIAVLGAGAMGSMLGAYMQLGGKIADVGLNLAL